MINLQLFADKEKEENGKEEMEIKENETKETSGNDNKEKTENLEKQNENVEEITKSLETINKSLVGVNNNLKMLRNDNNINDDEDISINISNFDNKKFLVDKNNNKLSDYEVFKRSLKMIEEDKSKGKNVQISPKFIKYMEKYVENVDKKIMPIKEFMQENIFNEIPLDEVII